MCVFEISFNRPNNTVISVKSDLELCNGIQTVRFRGDDDFERIHLSNSYMNHDEYFSHTLATMC